MTIPNHLIKLIAPCLLLFVLCPFLNSTAAQTATATLSGTILDQNGAVVPGVAVTVVNEATSISRDATTNQSGQFTVTFLPPGTYTITAKRDGFASVQVRDLALNTADQKSLAIQLRVGDVNQTVDVTGEESLIDTSPAVATTIDRTFVGNMPLNGRSFQSLIMLTPGVVLTQASSSPGQISVNGQRSNANYFTVDGVSANSGVDFSAGGGFAESTSQQLAGALPSQTALGTTQTLLSVDALEEFKIQTSTYSAEFGRQPGGQVQLTSRAGKNQFQGSLFEYVRNEAFDANDWFANSRPLTPAQVAEGLTKQPRSPLRQNQFGGTFSGPVVLPAFGEGDKPYWSGRDRTFFFFSYEGLRMLRPVSSRTSVPSMRLRQIAHPSVQPILNAFPIPTEPETLVNGQLSGFSPYTFSGAGPSSTDAISLRIDHAVNSKASIFGRYSTTPSKSQTRSLNRLVGGKNEQEDITLASTQLFPANLSNEIRFNYSRSRGRFAREMDDFDGAVPIDTSVLLSGYSGPGVKLGNVNLFISPNFLLIDGGDQADMRQEQFNIVNNFSWNIGSHHLKLGFDYRRLAPVYGPTEYQQDTTFNSLAGLITGTASTIQIAAQQGSRPRFSNYSFYVDDTWRARKPLTVNMGLRWEINPPAYDANGLKPTLVCGVDNVVTATLCPLDTPLRKTDYTAFAPRLGVAYALNENPGRETVLRGGFGLYYDLGNTVDIVGFSRYPFRASKTLLNVAFPLSPEQALPPLFPSRQPTNPTSLTALNDDLKLPVTLQWNAGVEQSLGTNQVISVSYVAAAGRRLLSTRSLNNVPSGLTRPNPNFGSIAYTTNGPTSDYHSMQVRFQRRLSRGLQALANYTWSHAIDEASNEFDGTLEKGNASFDVRHNLSAAITFDTPKINTVSFFDALLNSWSFDSLVFLQSGTPLNVVNNILTLSDGTRITNRPDVVAGVPLWVDDPTAPGGRRINRSAFADPIVSGTTQFRQGSLGRNVIPGPSSFQVNLGVRRQFDLGERLRLQIKGEAFNVFNRPHFGFYETTWSSTSTTFGLATSTLNRSLGGLNPLYQIGGPRSLQFSARLVF